MSEKRIKGSEWWSEAVGVVVAEKRRTFENDNREERDGVKFDRYRAQRVALKQTV